VIDDSDRSGEVWKCDVTPHGLRIHYVLGRSIERTDQWDTLILFDQGAGEEGQMEQIPETTFDDHHPWWSQLL
jgi:hypothetical protein